MSNPTSLTSGYSGYLMRQLDKTFQPRARQPESFPVTNTNAGREFSCADASKELDSIGGQVPKGLAQPDAKLLAQKYIEARAADYGVSREHFERVVTGVLAKYASDPKSAEALLRSLRFEELTLARGCAAGNERAWTEFMTRYRVTLYDSARSITRDDSSGRELADGIYAELYGMSERDGVRKSKFDHYSGRGSLEGWLRTVLAQEWVNRFRKTKRETSLEEQEEAGAQFTAAVANPLPQDTSALAKATDAALAAMAAEDRYVIASYHLDGRRLAEIAKTLGVHESTVSRRVERIAAQLRAAILKHLQQQGLSRRQAEEALEADVRDLNVDVRARLAQTMQEGAAGAFSQSKETK